MEVLEVLVYALYLTTGFSTACLFDEWSSKQVPNWKFVLWGVCWPWFWVALALSIMEERDD